MARKVVDGRDVPSERNCTLTIAGEEGEVVPTAAAHMIEYQRHGDTPELREDVREDDEGRELRGLGPSAGSSLAALARPRLMSSASAQATGRFHHACVPLRVGVHRA